MLANKNEPPKKKKGFREKRPEGWKKNNGRKKNTVITLFLAEAPKPLVTAAAWTIEGVPTVEEDTKNDSKEETIDWDPVTVTIRIEEEMEVKAKAIDK